MASQGPADQARKQTLLQLRDRLRPIHQPLGKPKPGDWLSQHPEPGQTFEQYLACNPALPRGERKVLCIQPLGNFTKEQRKIVELTGEFMGLYFQLPVRIEKDLPTSLIPAQARRHHPHWGMEQFLTTFILDDILLPRLPKDAAAYLALTASDLWPGEGWNFVFGQATLRERVGVWSIFRNGEPEKGVEEFRLVLLRTLKTATHETGHMFSILHCTAYECNMCGSNHRQESDARPLALCPECLPKICWAVSCDPKARFEKLAAFCEREGLTPEAAFYKKSIETLAKPAD